MARTRGEADPRLSASGVMLRISGETRTEGLAMAEDWPTYAVVDRTGTVRALGIAPDYVEKVLDLLLKEQPEKK